jgi:GST-like protein
LPTDLDKIRRLRRLASSDAAAALRCGWLGVLASDPGCRAYAVNRYDFEAWRHWNIIEERLSKHPYMLGDEYGIVDIALWPWARMIPRFLNENAFEKPPNVKRFLDEVGERPAAKRALGLQTMHEFKTSLDDEARKALFPSNERLKTTGV